MFNTFILAWCWTVIQLALASLSEVHFVFDFRAEWFIRIVRNVRSFCPGRLKEIAAIFHFALVHSHCGCRSRFDHVVSAVIKARSWILGTWLPAIFATKGHFLLQIRAKSVDDCLARCGRVNNLICYEFIATALAFAHGNLSGVRSNDLQLNIVLAGAWIVV